jgi:hypothetical protein
MSAIKWIEYAETIEQAILTGKQAVGYNQLIFFVCFVYLYVRVSQLFRVISCEFVVSVLWVET